MKYIKAFGMEFNYYNKNELQELKNFLYDDLIDQYQAAGILIIDDALDREVDELIERLCDQDDEWEEYA